MALYAIGDLHLSLNSDKPMDIFGEKWHGYVDKIKAGFAPLGENDVTVLCGDDGVHHNRDISAGWVLHTCRDADAAGGQTVLLVFDGTGTDGNVR